MDQRETAWRQEAQDRYDNYAMLARLFQCEVDVGLLADLKESFVAEPTGNSRFDEGCALLRRYLDGVDDMAREKSALAIDYCLTFLGYGTDPDAADETGLHAAYPYESVYRSEEKALGGDRCARVSQAYRAGEFAPDMERIVAQDHLACELSFMRHLVGREMAAWDGGDVEGVRALRARQAAFLGDHLAQWLEPFEGAVEKFSETDFYRGLARMTGAWVEMDAASLTQAQWPGPCE